MEGRVMPKLRSDGHRSRSRRLGSPCSRAGPGCWPPPGRPPGPEPDRVEVLSRLQRHRRCPAAQCRRPRPRRPVGRGGRDLSARHPAVRRQGRQIAQGRPGRGPDGRIGPLRRPAPVLPATARRAAARGAGPLPQPRRRPGRALVSPGRGGRGPGALRRVVELAFCSSWGDDALDLLGDLAFQDGRFAEALAAYRQLVPDRPTARGLIHPDPSVDLARVAAKKLLCRAALGDDPPTPGGPRGVRRGLSERRGTLAGRKGPDLESWPRRCAPTARAAGPARRPLADVRRLADADPGRAGHDRRRLVPVARRAREPSRRAGAFPVGRVGCRSAPIAADRLLAYHPIVLGDQVVVCDETGSSPTTSTSGPTARSAAPRARSRRPGGTTSSRGPRRPGGRFPVGRRGSR